MQVETADDYWTDESDAGTAATWRFQGRDGLDRLSGPAALWSPAPADFDARLTRVQLDHVAVELFRSSPHRSERGADQLRRHPTPLLTVVVVLRGRLLIELPTAAFTLDEGACAVIDSRDPVAFTAEREVQLLRSVVGVRHLPEELEQRGATIARPLPRSALVESFIAFAGAILRRTTAGRPATGEHLIAAMADLQAAVLAEAQSRPDWPTGPAGLRLRIEAHIHATFRDPDLSPTSIARTFDVSLRHVHAVFEGSGCTVAQVIRDRRVSWAARRLRMGAAPRLQDLARLSGFSSRDVLTRAFQQRFGLTPSEYRDGGHRSFGED